MPDDLNSENRLSIQKRKEQGRAYLQSNQVDRALRIFSGILRENPDDLDSILILGDAYLMVGDKKSALALYQQATRFAPERRNIVRRVAMLQTSEELVGIPVEPLPTQPRAIAELIQRITGNDSPVSEPEVQSATRLLDEYIKSSSPAQAVAERLEEIDMLLPALIELNIRQARADGKLDLVDALQDLLANVLLQTDLNGDEKIETTPEPSEAQQNNCSNRILVVGEASHESPFRLELIIQMMRDYGVQVDAPGRNLEHLDWNQYGLVIGHNPHGYPEILQGLEKRSQNGLPVLVSLDTDFEKLPPGHPDYDRLGVPTPEHKASFQAMLHHAGVICVTSDLYRRDLKEEGLPVYLILEGWSQENLLWLNPPPSRSTFNIGISLLPGQVEDVRLIRRSVSRVLREIPHTRLLVSGDLESYQMFEPLPDVRRLFLPPVEKEDYPYLLSQMDLLLVPLTNTDFNMVASDRRLMEAGIRRIPWIASQIKSFEDWGSGGLFATSHDEWYADIVSLVRDGDLRQRLGKAGFQKALQRENHVLGKEWLDVVQKALSGVKASV